MRSLKRFIRSKLPHYDDFSDSSLEIFPRIPGHLTGPLTLGASNVISVLEIKFPRGSIIQSRLKEKRIED